MKFYNKYFASNYDELITYYPRYYREVFEMEAILRAHGGFADGIEDNIELVYNNCFIDYMDEASINRLERFLNIGLQKSRTLEERRRMVKAYFVGFGKVSASMLAAMIQSYTGADVSIRFEPFDEEGNNMLYIDFLRGDEPTLYMGDINLLLSKKIPAHIQYQAAVTYRFPIGVGRKRRYYKYLYDLTGTKPDIASIGALVNRATVTEAHRMNVEPQYATPAEEDQLTGTIPDIATIGAVRGAESVVSADVENYAIESQKPADEAKEAGKWPVQAAIGRIHEAVSVIEAEAESFRDEHTPSGVLPDRAQYGRIYRHGGAVEAGSENYAENYDSSGTLPDKAQFARIYTAGGVIKTDAEAAVDGYVQAADDIPSGKEPMESQIGLLRTAHGAIEAAGENRTVGYPLTEADRLAGRAPDDAKVGAMNEINTEAEVSSTDYDVNYSYCGTRCTQS